MDICDTVLCAVNWLEHVPCTPVGVETMNEGGYPIFFFRRHEDGKLVTAIFCEEHIFFGLYSLMKLHGCEE